MKITSKLLIPILLLFVFYGCTVKENSGCMDSSACNFNPSATIQTENICVFSEQHYNCDGTCIDANENGTCDVDETSRSCADSKIVGGSPVSSPDMYPFIVSLQLKMDGTGGYSHVCGASVISDQYLLTAAHCSYGYEAYISQAKVVFGSLDYTQPEESVGIDSIIVHPDFNPGYSATPYDLSNDIAIIKLSQPIDTSKYTPIRYKDRPETTINEINATPGECAKIIGWGLTENEGSTLPTLLQEVSLPIQDNASCYEMNTSVSEVLFQGESMFCAGFEDGGFSACNGDSGGPVMLFHDEKPYQVGIVSWGLGCALPAPNHGVYVRLSTYSDWISTTISGVGCTDSSACNYVPSATQDDGSCTYPEPCKDCNGNCIDVNQNGICDADEHAILEQCTETSRIIGGTPVPSLEDATYMVSLQINNSSHFCGGSIISDTHILTAAHCLTGASSYDSLRVVFGTLNNTDTGHSRSVKTVTIHPNYNPGTMKNDIALIELSSPISNAFTPIQFLDNPNTTSINEVIPTPGDCATVMGWGNIVQPGTGYPSYPSLLHHVTLPIQSDLTCSEMSPMFDDDTMFCGGYPEGGFDSCQGDSGGPIVIQKDGTTYQLGVVSWGYGCAKPAPYYGVYTQVSNYSDWISAIISGLGCTDSSACNYTPSATQDDGSCIYPVENYDCNSECIETIDCHGECGGDGVLDDCGICDGDNSICPIAPTNLSATSTNDTIQLHWDAEPTAISYTVYRKPTPSTNSCEDGYISDCNDGHCCNEDWLDDGLCDDGNWGCVLTCYDTEEDDCSTSGNASKITSSTKAMSTDAISIGTTTTNTFTDTPTLSCGDYTYYVTSTIEVESTPYESQPSDEADISVDAPPGFNCDGSCIDNNTNGVCDVDEATILDQCNQSSRIIGGTPVSSIDDAPFMVSLQINSYGHFCGGSIITDSYILTAAHCLEDFESYDSLRVVFGTLKNTETANSRTVKNVTIHPNYSSSTMKNDIALIELSSPISNTFTPVEFMDNPNTASINEITPIPGDCSTVIGWGNMSTTGNNFPSLLHHVTVPIQSDSVCSEMGSMFDDTTMFCGGYPEGGFDSCQGDSGGPIVIQKEGTTYQLGVVSWGYGCAKPAPNYGVYAQVSNYSDWILSIID